MTIKTLKRALTSCMNCPMTTKEDPDVVRALGWRSWSGQTLGGADVDRRYCPVCAGTTQGELTACCEKCRSSADDYDFDYEAIDSDGEFVGRTFEDPTELLAWVRFHLDSDCRSIRVSDDRWLLGVMRWQPTVSLRHPNRH